METLNTLYLKLLPYRNMLQLYSYTVRRMFYGTCKRILGSSRYTVTRRSHSIVSTAQKPTSPAIAPVQQQNIARSLEQKSWGLNLMP